MAEHQNVISHSSARWQAGKPNQNENEKERKTRVGWLSETERRGVSRQRKIQRERDKDGERNTETCACFSSCFSSPSRRRNAAATTAQSPCAGCSSSCNLGFFLSLRSVCLPSLSCCSGLSSRAPRRARLLNLAPCLLSPLCRLSSLMPSDDVAVRTLFGSLSLSLFLSPLSSPRVLPLSRTTPSNQSVVHTAVFLMQVTQRLRGAKQCWLDVSSEKR